MKQLSTILATAIILFFASCSGSGSEEKKAADTTATTTTTAPAKPVFQPYNISMIMHKVKDFGKWKVVYLSGDSIRGVYGVSKLALGRELQDTNKVIVFNKIDDVAKAKQFAALPDLKELMKKAGVISAPTFDYLHVIRDNDSAMGISDQVLVKHKVKDFDAWLKAYDNEGTATRTSFGMVDIGLARGLEDSSTVYILFGITDMAKAKARGSSPELKKIMTDAGVIGAPEMYFFKEVQ